MTVETPHADWRREQPVIDMHTHVSADHVDEAVEIMDLIGLQKLVDISPSFGDRFTRKHEAFAEYPDRFDMFGGIDFEGFGTDGWLDRELDRLERQADRGAVGIKFHKALGLDYTDESGELVPVDDERIAPVIERAGELGLVVAFHIADPKAFFEPLDPRNERYLDLQINPQWWFGDREEYPVDWWMLIRQLESVIQRHDDTTILGVHWGCAAEEVGYVADVMRNNPNYIVDVSARVPEIGRHHPGLVHDVFVDLQDRVLFGTDLGVRDPLMLGAPQGFDPDHDDTEEFYDRHWRFFETDAERMEHPTPSQGRWSIDAIDLPRDVLEKFYVENAQRHLGV